MVELLDTTLRDGTQTEGISLSVSDKLHIAKALDDFGIDIIEGGWPGSNPRDEAFFSKIKDIQLKSAKICAFGSTARRPGTAGSDQNLKALLKAETPIVTLVGKTWKLHAEVGLGLNHEENKAIISESVAWLIEHGRRVIFDAEHFFDGYKDDSAFALAMIGAAAEAGADTIALCDTNGGSLPSEIAAIVRDVQSQVNVALGIHAHNDGELAAANSLAAVEEGAVHVQGTINGVGERCGNANLCSIIPSLLLKMDRKLNPEIDLPRLAELSRSVAEIMNLAPNPRAPFVGKSAFSHKGGIHVSAVMKDPVMYEHIKPELVGGSRHVLVSDLSGQSNIRYKAGELGIDLDVDEDKRHAKEIVQLVKALEYEGYQFDGADASFELLLRKHTGEFTPYFHIEESRVYVRYDKEGHNYSEAVMKVNVGGETEHTAAEGVGPVNALDNALRKALTRFYPDLSEIELVDYKVRVLDQKGGTSAKVRVLIETSDHKDSWFTVGVSENIIEASWQALRDSANYKLFKSGVAAPAEHKNNN